MVECKSLQTASIKKTGEVFTGTSQCDASDRRKVQFSDGTTLETTCLLTGEFDILAVNLFAFEGQWRFVFAKNADLPRSTYRKYLSVTSLVAIPPAILFFFMLHRLPSTGVASSRFPSPVRPQPLASI